MPEPVRAERDEGGEPPCWMDRVCMRCGAFIDGPLCGRCGADPREPPAPGSRASDGTARPKPAS